MTKKYRKFISTKILFSALMMVGIFSLFTNIVLASTLEVSYPAISGQTLTAETKLPDFVKYLFNLGMALGFFSVFISLIIAGVMRLLSPIQADLIGRSKERIGGAISGLLILASTYLIITTINPQLSILKLTELPPSPQPEAEKRTPGVYFYPQSGCSNDRINPNTSSIPDLGDSLRNRINSVGIIKDPDTKTAYISILYDNTNLWGKCQYLDPNLVCQPVSPFAASASIYKYDDAPNDDGVYFFRKSNFDEKGGYYKVKNAFIAEKGIYTKKLDELKFTGEGSNNCNVPEEEQDCIKYDKTGKCTKDDRRCPSLGGENVSSIKINGSYLVMLVYFDPKVDTATIWSSCQEFPTITDVNKTGPQQIKWQFIRNSGVKNSGGIIPNYAIIIPIQR